MTKTAITIGKLSAHTGVKIETIRYYEKIGVLPAPARTPGGFRVYDTPLIKRLMFIRRCRALGFSLDDIRSLLGLEDRPPSCAEAYAITARHLEGVRAKVADLKKLEQSLSKIARECDQSTTADCPIIDALSAGG